MPKKAFRIYTNRHASARTRERDAPRRAPREPRVSIESSRRRESTRVDANRRARGRREADVTRTEMRDVETDAMARVRAAQTSLRAQLEARLHELNERSVDADRALRAAKREREDVGVELYALQGELARSRAEWVSTDETRRRCREARETAERDTEAFERDAEGAARALEEARGRAMKRRVELEDLALATREDGAVARDREGVTAVIQRIASVTSDMVDTAERERLNREIRIKYVKECVERARAAALENVKAAEDAERDAAAIQAQIETCDDAISSINTSMDASCKRWKFVLQQVGKEDEMLERSRTEVRELEESCRLLDAERDGVKEGLVDAYATQSTHVEVLSRLDKDIEVADALIVSLRAAIDDKKSQSDAVQLGARNHDEISRGEERRANEIDVEIERVDQSYVVHTHALFELQERALLHVAEKMTTNKLAQKLMQSTREFRERARVARNESTVVKHKVAKTKIEMLRSSGEESTIRERLADVEKNVAERRVAIDACEREIARNVEAIENNTSKMDALNKTLEKLRDVSPEHVGPLEAQIAHLRNEIKSNEQNCRRLREIWLRAQKVIVSHEERCRDAIEQFDRHVQDNNVLTKKRDRHERNSRRYAEECESMNKTIERQRRRLCAIDEKIAQTESSARENAIRSLEVENARAGEIDALSGENLKLRVEISNREEAVRTAHLDADRINRAIADLERRIEFERHAQIMLDPTKGNSEVASAKQENAKLAVVLHKLESTRSNIAAKVESCVKRREIIVAKGDVIQSKIDADGEEAREAEMVATAKRARSDVRRRLAEAQKATADLKPKLDALEKEYLETQDAHGKIAAIMSDLSDRRDYLRVDATTRLNEKYERALLGTSSLQKMAQRFEKLGKGGEGTDENVERSNDERERYAHLISRLESKRDKLSAAIRYEINQHPHLTQSLRRAQAYLSVC